MRIKGWSKLGYKEIFEAWCKQFDTEEEAIVTAIWCANRLVKDKARSTKSKFYDLKDHWITLNQNYLVKGQGVREEKKDCRDCRGFGKTVETKPYLWDLDRADETWDIIHNSESPSQAVEELRKTYKPNAAWLEICDRCNGTGIYKSRWLYLHTFDVNGQRYSFHSYVRPGKVDPELGEDKETFGGKFSEEELAELSLPMSGLLNVLHYVARSKWGLWFNNGRYYGG